MRYITKISRNLEMYKRKKENGFNSSKELVLHVIRHNKGITQDGVGKILSLDKALITRIVKELISEGLVYKEKSTADKRAYMLFSTPLAEGVKDEIVNMEENYYKIIFSDLNDSELEAFLSLLEKVYKKSKDIRKKNSYEEI